MPRSWRHRVEDILEAIKCIEGYVQATSAVGFAADTRTIQAVAFNFVVIGEAAARMPDSVTNQTPEIPW